MQWEYLGISLKPDIPEDRDGVFSGCAFIEEGKAEKMEFFYTGNVEEEGEYDYVHNGRGANVIWVASTDGIHFSGKEILLQNKDYPKWYTCHIRDPKVWKEGGVYYMLLGGRKDEKGAGEDKGAVLLYQSKDKKNWEFKEEFSTEEYFGFMWECPDYFSIDGRTILSTCPQGIEREEYCHENGDLSGYFRTKDFTTVPKNVMEKDWLIEPFVEWDRGFDFYAPQTFQDENGRRILIGWVGLPWAEYTNKTTIKEGWQHCLTVPRVLTAGFCLDENGIKKEILLQNPVEEINQLRGKMISVTEPTVQIEGKAFDACFRFADGKEEKAVVIGEDLKISYKNGIAELAFQNQTGEGRKVRKAKIYELRNLRILKDTSIVEYFINDGEYVFTTRYYPKCVNRSIINISGKVEQAKVWEMRGYNE